MAVIDKLNGVRTGGDADDITLTGTVDGVEVTAHVWLSALQQLLASTTGGAGAKKAAVRTYCAQQLKAAHDAANVGQPANGIDFTGPPIEITS